MATGAAAEMMLRCVMEGSLVMKEIEVERRPYHRNCSCALHNLNKGFCSSASSRPNNISFSNNKTLNQYSLSMATTPQSSFQNGSSTTMGFFYVDGQNYMSQVRR